jgi:hypothetical protein
MGVGRSLSFILNQEVPGSRRVNTVQKCVHMYVNAKMIPVETIPGMEGG